MSKKPFGLIGTLMNILATNTTRTQRVSYNLHQKPMIGGIANVYRTTKSIKSIEERNYLYQKSNNYSVGNRLAKTIYKCFCMNSTYEETIYSWWNRVSKTKNKLH
jgi:hypothetical protein